MTAVGFGCPAHPAGPARGAVPGQVSEGADLISTLSRACSAQRLQNVLGPQDLCFLSMTSGANIDSALRDSSYYCSC